MAVALAVSPATAPAQETLVVTNLLDARNGYDPFQFDARTNRAGLYDQLQLDYYRSRLQLGFRYETERDSEDQTNYGEFTQRYAAWSEDLLRLRVGNFYTILGRGITHRSFELPGVILEQPSNRSRYGPSRDVDGVLVEAGPAAIHGTFFAGSPSDATISPGSSAERYTGNLFGAQIAGSPRPGTRLGATYGRFDVSSSGSLNESEWGSGFLEVDPLSYFETRGVSLPLYAEYATLGGTVGDWWRFETGDSVDHALYLGGNLLAGPLTVSAEWKDYWGFRLGTNDPPSLIREHTRTILNRATHVLRADDEEGYQLELGWRTPDWLEATANWSRADGHLGTRAVRFEERYLEVRCLSPRSFLEVDAFVLGGQDEFDRIADRDAWGFAGTVPLPSEFSFTGDFEQMYSTRAFPSGFTEEFEDLFVSAGFARAGWGSAAVVWERTSDPALEDPDDAAEAGVQPNHFVSGIVSALLGARHEARLTVGEQRGGRACTAGTCYEVVPFTGVELRLTSRFR